MSAIVIEYILHGPCRRPAGKYVLRPMDGNNGYKGRSSYLADNLGGRWSCQAGGYVLSAAAARDFEILWGAGFDGGLRIFHDTPAAFEHERLGGYVAQVTRAQALKLAAEWAAP